jgi:archaemetzincin
MGMTMQDLYPHFSWNFVFGQASMIERVGVYSFARYNPAFYGRGEQKDCGKILLRRSCKVLAHELCHQFGISHCIYYHCIMNGSNHLEESDARPYHLCPMDLRKLFHSIGFDPEVRYNKLLDFYVENSFKNEAEWIKNRLRNL